MILAVFHFGANMLFVSFLEVFEARGGVLEWSVWSGMQGCGLRLSVISEGDDEG